MFTSQMTSVSLAPKSSLVLQATTASSIAVLRVAGFPCRSRHQQTRGFRFGLWASYLDPNFQKELQRRHRIIKHKYTEALHRKLLWDRCSQGHSRGWGLRGLMCSSWHRHDTRPGGRWINVDELRHMKDSLRAMKEHSKSSKEDLGAADDRGIEDVEQNALDKLFGRQEHQKIMFNNSLFGWTWVNTTPKPTDTTTNVIKQTSNLQKRYRPIAYDNERIFESSTFSSPEMEYVIDPITNRKVFKNPTTKSKNKPEVVDREVTEIPVKTFKGYRSQFSQYEPLTWNLGSKAIHLDGGESVTNGCSIHPETQSAKDELDRYTPYKYNEPDGKIPNEKDTVEDGLMDFDHRYKPFKFHEPDGKFPEQPSLVSEDVEIFDHEYKPFKHDEPNGNLSEPSHPASQGLNDSTDLYRSYKYNEPNGKSSAITDQIDVGLTDYDRQPIVTDFQHGEVQSINWLSQEGFASNARNAGREEAAASTPPQINGDISSIDKSSYSRLTGTNLADVDRREDLDLLRASDIRAASGILKKHRDTQAEKVERRTALEFDFREYSARLTQTDDEAAESIKQRRKHAQDLEIERSYLLNHNAHAKGRVNAKLAELDAELAPRSPSPVVEKKLTGNFVRDFPEEFSTSWDTHASSNNCLVPKNATDSLDHDKTPKDLEFSYQNKMENAVQSVENDYAAYFSSREISSGNSEPIKLETSLQRSLNSSKPDTQVIDNQYSMKPQGMETSFAEEKAALEDCNSPIFTSSYGCDRKLNDKELVHEIRDIYESTYGTITNEHQQAPNQEATAMRSKIEDNGSLEDTKSADSSISTTSGASVIAAEPILYKILAYDPIMQTINFAETTSIVPDTSSALTPAEVLLRLSNPSKFFPHFKPLQSQGYEIVSGSGDVLVFRKVRDGAPSTSTSTEPEILSTSQSRKVVNPIDGMQTMPQPGTNFSRLSPTGFVNHDLPSEPPFVSGIDVRREEPVFSGRGNGWQEKEDGTVRSGRKAKKTGRGLLIGAAWVAACSYAVGVVAEFFKTGGSDGKGPVGF